MPKNRYENYRHERKWVEIIKVQPKKEENTPTEIIKREFEEIAKIEHELKEEVLKSADVDTILPKLKELAEDERKGIREYESLIHLFKIIVFKFGYFENENKELDKILSDEKQHLQILERMIKDLTW